MKRIWVACALWGLVACNDSSNLETVQSQPLSKKDKTTLGAVLDKRPVCDKVIWSETPAPEQGGDARVDYQCELSAVQVGEHFSAQRAVWVSRYQQRLDDAKARQAEILAKKRHESSALTIAFPLFEQLQASEDLPRYKALVKDSPVHHQPLAAVNAFFASDEGASYLAAHHGEDAPAVSEALANVTQAIAAAGLATETQEIDVCQTPALLVLAVILTPEEVRQGFNECQTSADARYAGDLTRVEQQMAAATVRLDNISKNLDLVGVKETLTWTVPEEGLPRMSAHRFVLSVKGDKAPRTLVKEMELSEGAMADVVAGDFNMTYQNMLISAMSDLVR